MLKYGLLSKHKQSDFVEERKELDSLVTAMREIGVLEETVRLLSQRLPLELHRLTRDCLEECLGKYRIGSKSSTIFAPFLIRKQMKPNEVIEFEGFAPHLDELAQKLFILHTVIYMSFKVIFSEQIADSDQLWSKTRAALLKEANDFILAFTSTSQEGISMGNIGVGDLFKSSLPKGTFNYSFRITAPKEYCPSLIKTMILPLTEKEREAAEKMAALNSVDRYSTLWMRNSLETGINPDLQYLPLLAYPYCHLINWAGINDSSFIDNLLINNYLPFLESYCIQSIAHGFSPQLVALCEDISDRKGLFLINEDSAKLLITYPVIEFCRVFDDVCAALYHLQIIQSEMETLLLSLCQLFAQKCQNHVNQILRNGLGAESSEEDIMCMSGTFIRDQELRRLLLQSNTTGDKCKEQQNAVEEVKILERLKADRSIRKEELLKSFQMITSLLIWYSSLSLLPSTLVKKKTGKLSGLTSFYLENSEHYCVYLGVEPNEVYRFSPEFSSSYALFVTEIANSAKDCLLTCRCELRALCMYHLDLAFREGHYHVDSFESFTDGPDQHVSRLADCFVAFKEAVRAASLDQSITDFIFSGLYIFVEHLLIHNIRYIRGPLCGCQLGMKILRANVQILEQVLQVIEDRQINLKRASAYYDLVEMSTEQFMMVLSETRSQVFTLAELQVILRLHYSGCQDDKELANQMVRLKYLYDGK